MSRCWRRIAEPWLLALALGGCATTATPPRQPPAPPPTPPAAAPAPAEGAFPASFAQALALLEAGDDEGAHTLLEALARRPDAPPGVHLNLALVLRRAGLHEAALAAVDRALAAAPDWAPALNLRGVLLRSRGRIAEAEAAYRAAIAADPAYAPAHRNLGVLYEVFLDRPRDARDHYRRYLALTGSGEAEAWLRAVEDRLGERGP